MIKLALVVAATSVATLMATQVVAAPTGAAMTYSSSIVITGIADGTGSGTGTASFDDSGTLTIDAETFTTIPAFSASATVTSSTVYNGSISGSTWTGDGTTSVSTLSCAGDALICDSLGVLPTLNVPDTYPVFSVDTESGGNWPAAVPNGLVTVNSDNTLTPVPVIMGDPTAVPTLPIYGLGLTIAALLGAAARGLRLAEKR